MRDYKFRGKRIDNGEWVYGYYFKHNEQTFIMPIFDEPYQYEQYSYEVDPETVGQYTGLKDRNGKEIYDGDIVQFGNRSIRNIKYDRGSFTMFDGESRRSPLSDFVVERTIEVIGNIYENPELLAKETNQ